jgi:hypothetical protein
MPHRVDNLYYWCRGHLQEAALAYTRGECRYQTLSNWAQHTLDEIRKLHTSGSDSLLKLPQA